MNTLKSILSLRTRTILFALFTITFFHESKAQCGSALALTPSVSQTTACSGSTITVSLPQVSVVRWIYRDNSEPWIPLLSSSLPIFSHSAGFTSAGIRQYRAIISHSGCTSDTSAAASVGLVLNGFGNNHAIIPSASKDTICSGTTVTLFAPSQHVVHSWLYRDSLSGNWQVFATGNRHSISMSTTTNGLLIRSVRVLVYRNGSCMVDTSAEQRLVFTGYSKRRRADVVAVASANEVCNGTFVGITMPSVFKIDSWHFRDNGGIWQNISSTSSSISQFASSTTSVTREYAAVFSDSSFCTTDTSSSAFVQIKVHQPGYDTLQRPSISSGNVCSGSPVVLNGTSSTAAWLRSTSTAGPWTATNGFNTTLTDTQTNVSQASKRYYRMLTLNAVSCTRDSSGIVEVNIRPNTYGNSTNKTAIVSDTMFCSGESIYIHSYSSLDRCLFSSNSNGPWSLMPSTVDTGTTVNTVTNRYYRLLKRDVENCAIDTFSSIHVSIRPRLYNGTTVKITPYADSATVCAGRPINVSLSPMNSGYISDRWIFSVNNGAFVSVPSSSGSTSITQNTTGVVSNTLRTYRMLLYNINTCIVDTSIAVHVNIEAQKYGNINSAIPFSARTRVCSGTGGVVVNITPPSGYRVVSWLWRNNNTGNWILVNNSASASYNDINTVVTVNTLRSYRALLYNPYLCQTDTSAELVIPIVTRQGGVSNRLIPTTTGSNVVCSGSSITASFTPDLNTNIQQWLWKSGNGNWNVVTTGSGTFTNSYQVLSAMQHEIRVVYVPQSSENCMADTSLPLTFQVVPLSGGILTNVVPTISPEGRVCAGERIRVQNSTSGFYAWMTKDTSGWVFPKNARDINMFDSNTHVVQPLQREYRFVYFRAGGSCAVDTSQSVFARIFPIGNSTSGGQAPTLTQQSVCAGNTINLIAGFQPFQSTINWQYLKGDGAWLSLGVTSSDVNTRVTQPEVRHYRVIRQNRESCLFDTSASTPVLIRPFVYANNNTLSPLTSTTACRLSSQTVSFSPPSNTFIEYWLTRTNQSAWVLANTVNTNNSQNFDNSKLPANAQNVSYRVLLRNTNTCSLDSSAALTLNIKNPIYGNLSIAPNGKPITCASSSSVGASLIIPGGYQLSKWLYKSDYDSVWQDYKFGSTTFAGSTSVISDPQINVPHETARSYRVLLTSANRCTIDTTSAFKSVILQPQGRSVPTWLPVAEKSTVCSSQPAKIFQPSNATASYWIYKENNGPLKRHPFSVGGTLTDYLSDVIANQTRTYYSIQRSETYCRTDTSAGVEVNIIANSVGGYSTVAAGSNFIGNACEGANIRLGLDNMSLASNVRQWIYREASGPWINVWADHAAPYTSTAITREYRAILLNPSLQCKLDTTLAFSLTFNPYKYGKDSSLIAYASDTSCDGAAVSVTLSKSTFRSGWLYNDQNSAWKVIPEVFGNAIFDPNTSVSQPVLRTYVALVKDEAKCAIDTSMAKSVRLLPRTGRTLTNVKATTTDTVCMLASSVFASVNSSNVSYWIYRDNYTGPWNRIPNSNASTITHNTGFTPVSIIREYKAILDPASSCHEDSSVSDTVFIRGSQGGNISGFAPTTNATTYCSGDIITIGAPTFPSQYSFSRMLIRDNNGSWRVWRDQGFTDRNTVVTSVTTRSYRFILLNSLTCREDTSQIVNVTINPMNYGNTATTVFASNSNICSGVSLTLNTTPGSGRTMAGWLYRNNANLYWEILPGSFTSATDQNTLTSVSITRQYRALYYTSATCRIDSSTVRDVNINAFVSGTNSSINPVVSGSSCVESYNTISISPGSNTVRHWIARENGSPWFIIRNTQNNSFTDYYSGVTTPATRSYAAILVSTSTCSADTSNVNTITINTLSRGNYNGVTFSSTTSVCAGSTYTVNVNPSSLPTGSLPRRWIYRDNGSEWKTIETASLNITESNTLVTVNTTREYRLIILRSLLCREDTTNATSVNINVRSVGVDLSVSPTGPNTICRGTSANIAFNPGTGNFIHEWIYRTSPSGSWITVPGSTSTPLNQSPGSDTTISQIQYRVIIRKNTTCSLDTSGTYTLNILSPVAGTSTALTPQTFNTSVCSGARVNLYIPTLTIQSWIYRDNNGPWRELCFGNMPSVSDEPILSTTTTRTYRALYPNTTTCAIDTSAGVNVTINPPGTFSNVLAAPTAAQTTICSRDTVQIHSGVTSSSKVLLWQFRNPSGVWQNKKETSSSITEYNTETDTTLNRNYRMVVSNSSTCRIDTSTMTTISFVPGGAGNISVIPSSTDSIVCSGNPVGLSLPFSYTVVGWLYRDNSSGQWLTFGSGINTINDLNTTTSQQITRSYRAIVNRSNSCGRDTTDMRQVIIRPVTNGNFAHVPVASSDVVCSGNNAQISLTQTGGVVQSWLYRNNHSGNWLHIPWGLSTYIDTATSVSTPVTRSYRAITFFKNTCTIDTSAQKTIDIKPIIRTSVSQQPTASATSICSGQSVKLLYPTVSPTRIDRWLSRNGNTGNWAVFTTAYIDSITDNNTIVSNTIVRNYRAVTYTAQQCRFDTSAERAVTINISYGNDYSVKPSSAKDTVCKNGQVTLTANPSLQILGWLYNDGPTINWTLVNRTLNTFTDTSTSSNFTGIRRYRVLFKRASSCAIDTSDAKAITFAAPVIGRNNQIVPTPVQSFVCSGNFIGASVPGNVLHWVYRDNNVGNWKTTEPGKNTMYMNNTNVTQRTIRTIFAIVEKSDKCGYDTTASIDIVINVFKSLNNTILPDVQPQAICSGSEVKVRISGYEGNIVNWLYRDNYTEWFLLPGGSDSLVQRLTTTGVREYKVWLYTGCFTDSTLTRSVIVMPSPSIPVISHVGDSLFCTLTPDATYEWRMNDTIITQSNRSSIKPPKKGATYVVRVTNSNGCSNSSQPYYLQNTHSSLTEKLPAVIYPNPTTGELNVQLPEPAEHIHVSIMSAIGEVIQISEHNQTSTVNLQLGTLARGMYLIKVTSNGRQHIERIVLQ